MSSSVSVKVWGELALFTRPELKVERLSYPIMTPSAARGVLDAILFKPQMRWHIRRITALEPWWLPPDPDRPPYRLVGVRRNEIQGKISSRNAETWMNDASGFRPYLVDSAGRDGPQGENRTQRNSLLLHHVAYLIEATPLLTAEANRPRTRPEDDEDRGPDSVPKYVAIFERRVAKGQCFHRPYLGCREFACQFAAPDGTERPLVQFNESLGLMLYDIRFGDDHGRPGTNRPGFFQAQVTKGLLHCDTHGTGPNGEPPVTVFGWDEEGPSMILQRLYQLAQRDHLIAEPSFEGQPVPYVINLAEDGAFLGIEERRGEILIESRKKGGEPKKVPDKGKPLSVPLPHGSPNQPGFARFFADTLARVLPLNEDERSARSRTTFWKQIDEVADALDDPVIKAVQAFGRRLTDATVIEAVRKQAAEAAPTDRCTFAWLPHRGKTIVEYEPIRQWYRDYFARFKAGKQEDGPTGICQVTTRVGPMPTTHPIKVVGIPGGLPVGVSLVSYDKAAFESFGLEGTANAGVGCEAADAYPRAINALIANKLPGNPRTSLKVAGALFLFWTREPADTTDVMQIDAPQPEQVEHLLRSASAGQQSHALDDANQFYLLALSGNSARAIVRDYLETPLPTIRNNLGRWFRDLRIADLSRAGAGKPTSLFPLWQLVAATAGRDDASPEVPARLVRAALKGDPIVDSVLASCVGRLRAEGSEGFRPSRMALITLLRRSNPVPATETLDENEQSPAYVCGRLLAVFEQIQREALGDVNATVTDKYFGTFSAAPGMVLGRLYANSQNHLGKLRGDKPGAYGALDRLLTEVSGKLKTTPTGQLQLVQQAQFALGYYHQKARRFEEIAERKAAKAAKTAAAE